MESREGDDDATEDVLIKTPVVSDWVVKMADKLPIRVEWWLGKFIGRIGKKLEDWSPK